MSLDEVLELLRRKCAEAGGQAAWAEAAGVSPAYVSDVLNKRREPGKSILDPLGLERHVAYRKRRTKSLSHNHFAAVKRAVPTIAPNREA